MKLWMKASAAILAAGVWTTESHAQGFLGGQSGLDAKFCETAAVRQTVVYVDDMFLQTDQKDWAAKLLAKLKASLVPSERVTVVELSPADGQSREAWTGCWPDYLQEERDRLAKSYSFFSKSPLKALDEQQGYFENAFAGALSTIFDKHSQPHLSIDTASPPQKQIIAALASDGARYSQTKVTIRGIIYSDLAENSDLGSVFKPQPQPPLNVGKKLGTYLRSSVFYGFGVGGDVSGGEDVRDATRTLWTNALGSMSATIGGLSADLTVPNSVPITAREFIIDLKEGDQPLSGKLSVLADADGGLIDSWIGITRLSSAALSGTMHCEPGDTDNCTINAATSHGILSDSSSEVLTLRGNSTKALTGLIGVKGSNVMFALTATLNSN